MKNFMFWAVHPVLYSKGMYPRDILNLFNGLDKQNHVVSLLWMNLFMFHVSSQQVKNIGYYFNEVMIIILIKHAVNWSACY